MIRDFFLNLNWFHIIHPENRLLHLAIKIIKGEYLTNNQNKPIFRVKQTPHRAENVFFKNHFIFRCEYCVESFF